MKKLRPKPYEGHALVCTGKLCGRSGGVELAKALRRELRNCDAACRVTRTTCLGQCNACCVVAYEGPSGRWWGKARPDDAEKIAKKIAKRLKKAA